MKNIAIVGKMYAGKTTLANELVELGYTKMAMAGPLKALARFAYGPVEKDQEYETTNLETGLIEKKSGRQILQQIGQSMKLVDRDIWLKCFVNDSYNLGAEPYVVDDVRFGFEADYLRKHGWLIVKIETATDLRVKRALDLTGKRPTAAELGHESEREVDDIKVDQVLPGHIPLEHVPIMAHELVNGRAK